MFARPTQDSTGVKLEQVWTGEVDSSGSNAALLVVAPWLLDELLGEFPVRTGKPTSRAVIWNPPKNKK